VNSYFHISGGKSGAFAWQSAGRPSSGSHCEVQVGGRIVGLLAQRQLELLDRLLIIDLSDKNADVVMKFGKNASHPAGLLEVSHRLRTISGIPIKNPEIPSGVRTHRSRHQRRVFLLGGGKFPLLSHTLLPAEPKGFHIRPQSNRLLVAWQRSFEIAFLG